MISRDKADPKVAQTVRIVEQIGKSKYQEYVKNRLEKRTKPLADPINQNKYYLLSRQELRINSKDKHATKKLSQAELRTLLSTLCVLPGP